MLETEKEIESHREWKRKNCKEKKDCFSLSAFHAQPKTF